MFLRKPAVDNPALVALILDIVLLALYTGIPLMSGTLVSVDSAQVSLAVCEFLREQKSFFNEEEKVQTKEK